MITIFRLKGLGPIKTELDSTLVESASSFLKIKYWVAYFEREEQVVKTNIGVDHATLTESALASRHGTV